MAERESWRTIWKKEDEILKGAKRKVASLRDLPPGQYEGVGVSLGEEDRLGGRRVTISVLLSGEEIRNAPLAIRWVFPDLGISPKDRVRFEVEIPDPVTRFTIGLLPLEIEDSRIGIRLSTMPGESSLITPDHNPESEPPAVKETLLKDYSPLDDLGQQARLTYWGISGNVDGNNMFYRLHPHLIEILTSASDWMMDLLAKRKKQ